MHIWLASQFPASHDLVARKMLSQLLVRCNHDKETSMMQSTHWLQLQDEACCSKLFEPERCICRREVLDAFDEKTRQGVQSLARPCVGTFSRPCGGYFAATLVTAACAEELLIDSCSDDRQALYHDAQCACGS